MRNMKTNINKRKTKTQVQEHTEVKSETQKNTRNFTKNIKPKHIEYEKNNHKHYKSKIERKNTRKLNPKLTKTHKNTLIVRKNRKKISLTK